MAVRVEITGRTIVYALVALAGVWLLTKLWPVLLILIVALFLVGTLNPLVHWLERHNTGRSVSLAIVFVLLIGAIAGIAAVTIPPLVRQVVGLVTHAPTYQHDLAARLASYGATSLADRVAQAHVGDWISTTFSARALGWSSRIVYWVGIAFTTIFLAIYMISDRERVRGFVFALVPRHHHIPFARILLNLETIVGGYIRGQIITSVAMAVFTFALLTIVHAPNALAIAVFAGLTDVLPFVGALLAITPSCLAALASGGLAPAIAVLVALTVYQEIESRLIIPRVYGRALRLPSAAVIVALLAGGALLGIVGALIALPIAAGIRMVVQELRVELPGDATRDERTKKLDEQAAREYERRTEGAPATDAAEVAVKMAEKVEEQAGPEAPVTFTDEKPSH